MRLPLVIFSSQEELHQRGLARAGLTHNKNEFPVGDLQVDAVEGDRSVRVNFLYILEFYHSFS